MKTTRTVSRALARGVGRPLAAVAIFLVAELAAVVANGLPVVAVPGPASSTHAQRGPLGSACAWRGDFHLPDLDRAGRAMATYDAGSGPALYVAGDFRGAGPENAHYIARWDGAQWQALDGDLEARVLALAVYDGALYVAGFLFSIDGIPTGRIARWDGTWSTVGVESDDGVISALTVFDDGTGEALYATGSFSQIAGVAAERIAKFDGDSWQPLGGTGSAGLAGGFGQAMAVYDDGLGPDLYVGGTMTSAGGVPITTVARWDGSVWSDVGTGLAGGSIEVNALEVLQGELYAGGAFQAVDGVAAAHLARWNGTMWSDVAGGISQQPPEQPATSVTALRTVDLGTGPSLYVAGVFDRAGPLSTDNLARWDGSAWHEVGGGLRDRFGLGGIPFAVAGHDDGSGVDVYVTGEITEGGDLAAAHIVRWDGMEFSSLAQSGLGLLSGFASSVVPRRAMTLFDDGNGAVPIVGGFLSVPGRVGVREVMALRSGEWQPIRSANGFVPERPIRDAVRFAEGGSENLYVVHRVPGSSGSSENSIMRWDGNTWSAFATALQGGDVGIITDLEVLDDGSGPALFVSGFFDTVGGISANNIARFANGSWSDVGTDPRIDGVQSPVVHDPGNGLALFAAVRTTAGEQVVMRRDGATWTIIDGVYNGSIQSLVAFDAGGGPDLIVAGGFTSVTTSSGVLAANNITRFDGVQWSALGNGLGNASGNTAVFDLVVHDEGVGPRLFAAGRFIRASQGGLLVNNVARWDGASWTALASGDVPGIDPAPVTKLFSLGDTLYALGNFRLAGGAPSRAIAAWTCTTSPLFADGFESGDTSAWDATTP